jgi:peptidoglycan/LPS O-acetylase OafA/YrhL
VLSTRDAALILGGAVALLMLGGAPREALQALGLVAVIGAISMLPQGKDRLRGQDISYGIYLCHFPIIQMLLAAGLNAWSFGAYLATVIALAILYGLWSWNAIERPALDWGQGKRSA